jgi:hypothetical protein
MGTWTPQDGPILWRTLGNGVIPGYSDPDTAANDMAVSAGSGLQINVATGATVIDGHVYRCTSTTAKAISSNASGSTRYDRIVVRFTREGQTTEGACVLAVLEGTPGAGDAPALTRSAATYEVSLAKVRVVNGAASLTSGDITDERYNTALYQSYVPVNPNAFSGSTDSLRAGDILYVSNAGKLVPLRKGTDGQYLRLASGLPAWETQTITVTVQEGDVTVDAAVNTLDFDASDFNVSSSPAGEANIALAYGTSAGTPAEGNHLHTGVYAPASHTHSISQVTSLQTSLDDLSAEIGGRALAAHTHTMTKPFTGSVIKETPGTSVGTSLTTISSFTLGPLVSGVTYDVELHCEAQADAPGGGGYTDLYARIETTGDNVQGSRATTPSGERPVFAHAFKEVVGTGSSITLSMRAQASIASGSIVSGMAWGKAVPRLVPAS